MTLARLKTALLSLLVLSSLVLSYMLWHGNWTSTAEVGLNALPTLPTSLSPSAAVVTRPYQIVVSQAHPVKLSVFQPNSTAYTAWLRRLSGMRLSGLHQVPQWTMPRSANLVESDFGAVLSTRELLTWIPGLENSTFSVKASTAILYQTASGGPVNLVLTSATGSFVAQTDIAAKQFDQWTSQEVKQPNWQVWNMANANFVPGGGVTMPQVVRQTTTVSVMPLVDSFFVNPQAVTRIQESKQSVIWTDGSRAVRWNQVQGGLTFEDPNVGATSPTGVSGLDTALAYIRAHGGSPKDSILFSASTIFNGDNTQTYTVQTYVGGYPILDSLGNYTIELVNGHVLRYRRPLVELGDTLSTKQVTVLSGKQLQAVLHKLAPSLPPQSVTVQLGYFAQPNGPATVVLTPVYNISQSGIPLWTLDAVTGTVLKGMGSE